MDWMPRRPEPETMADRAEAEAYAAADFAEVNQAFVTRLCDRAGDRANTQAVDLGTGPGDIPIRLARARPSWHVVAVDSSPAMLALARKKVSACPDRQTLDRSIEFVLADGKATGLPDRSFDVVFSNSILHHITATDRLWAEVKRLGRPRAYVLFRDLARPRDEAAARRVVDTYAADESATLREEYYCSLLAAYTPDEVRRQLDRAGLPTLRVQMVSDRHMDVFGTLPE